MFFSLQARHPA